MRISTGYIPQRKIPISQLSNPFSSLLEAATVLGNVLVGYFCDVTSSRLTDVCANAQYVIVGIVTTFSIGRRTDVNSGAGSDFSMMISHGQSCSCTGR